MFWDNILDLCAKNNVSPNAMCANIGLSNATATKWKNGSIPHAATLRKVANYFNVSTEYLLTGTNVLNEDIKNPLPYLEKQTVYSFEGPEGADTATVDLSKFDSLNALHKTASTLSIEQIKLLTAMAENMKNKD